MSEVRGTTVGGSSCSTKMVNSRSQNEHSAYMKCYHNLAAVHQVCKKPPNNGRKFFGCPLWKVNEDCGFFEWEEEEIGLIEKNKMFEAKLGVLAMEVKSLKEHNGDNSYQNDQVSMLKEEITNLRNKASKEKQKRGKAEEELKALREENVESFSRSTTLCGLGCSANRDRKREKMQRKAKEGGLVFSLKKINQK